MADYITGIVIVGIVFLFFVFRELITWYWKLNKIVELLESINKKLEGAAPKQNSQPEQTKN